MNIFRIAWFGLFSLGLISHCLAADPPKGSGSVTVPVPFPDGVTDPEQRVAFVTSPKGGIQAVRLEDGDLLWVNDACAAAPWLVAGDRLIAKGERLFILDLKNKGKLLRECDAFDYPKVKVPDRCTVSFQLWDPRVTGDTLEASWYAVAAIDRTKGRPFNFEGWTGFNKAAPVGTVKIKLDTGKAEIQADPKPADITASQIPESAKAENQAPSALPEKLLGVWKDYYKDQNGRITMIDERLVGVSLVLEPVGAEFLKKLVLTGGEFRLLLPPWDRGGNQGVSRVGLAEAALLIPAREWSRAVGEVERLSGPGSAEQHGWMPPLFALLQSPDDVHRQWALDALSSLDVLRRLTAGERLAELVAVGEPGVSQAAASALQALGESSGLAAAARLVETITKGEQQVPPSRPRR